MNITRFSIKRPVGISMIIMLFVVLGLYSLQYMSVELLPALNTPYVTVSVRYEGAGTKEIETQVIKPLEDALSSVPHLKHMTSVARPEFARIMLEFDFSANADLASIEATKQVNSVRRNLPEGIDEPVVLKRDIDSAPVLEIAIAANEPLSDVYSKAENIFKERLQRADGVSEVELYGGREKEIAVDVDQGKLQYYQIALNQIVSAIRSENLLLPAGTVYNDETQADVRLLAQYQTPAEIGQLQLQSASGQTVPLDSVAEIHERDARVSRYSRTNGTEVISLAVYANSDANIVNTAAGALEQLDGLRAEYPDYDFIVIEDTSRYVNTSLKNTFGNLLEGLMTTSLVLYLFLRGWRSTVAVIIAIPTSLISTFFVMYVAGFSFNMMSLMGMALCIGILVDDSIVVLENIHRHLHMGKRADIAAEEGRSEIGMAAISIALCDVVVFLPIAFMTGMTGQFFRQFGLTIVFATLFSLIVSFTLTPMLASKLFKHGLTTPKGRVWEFMEWLEQTAIIRYEAILRYCLSHQKKVFAAVLALFVFSVSLLPLGIIGAEYMPRTDESSFQVSVELAVGQNLQQTNAVVANLERYIADIPEVTNYLSRVGTPSSNNGTLIVKIRDRKDRSRSVWEITDQVRAYARANLPGASVRVNETQSSVAGVGGSGGFTPAPIQIRLLGANMDSLVAANSRVMAMLPSVNGIKDVRSNYTEGLPELQLTVDREKTKFYRTSVAEIGNVFRAAIAGQTAGVFANDPNNGGEDTDIRVRIKGSDGFTLPDIEAIPIMADGKQIPLSNVASVSEGTGPVALYRVDKQRAITVQANVTDRPLQEVLNDIAAKMTPEVLGDDISYRFAGQASSMEETFSEMFRALALSLVLVYMLLAVLYESLLTPLIRMFSLPLGLIGSLLFLAITGNSINLYSLIGILVMDGLVAKNGTLLLDYTLTLIDEGYSALDAVIEAGKTRLKPIFMTTITMVVGMMPIALSMTEGSETRVSMAWVIIGGLLTSTVFTLIIIPIVFLYFETTAKRQWAGVLRMAARAKAKLLASGS